MQPFYVATERFDPERAIGWDAYVKWAKIPALAEVVSLDLMLCPSLIKALVDNDWKHLNQNGKNFEFADLDYLIQRVADFPIRNILGVLRNPENHLEVFPGRNDFEFLGYDLIEDATGISALTNCGGFPNSFANDELNRHGLISNFERAVEVRRVLLEMNPGEPHAQCELYSIWRLIEAGQFKG